MAMRCSSRAHWPILGAALLTGCAGSANVATGPGQTLAVSATRVRTLPVSVRAPASEVRKLAVGVWVNPGLVDSGPTSVDSVQTVIGRTFDYALHYANLTDPFPDMDERDDITYGRTPIVSIRCLTPLTQITNGSMNAAIDALAAEMTAYGRPIELRYCWEMNVVYENASKANYVASWIYFHKRFVADGVTNVRWFFCPGATANFLNTGMLYYPGDAYVDDIGFDVYDRTGVGFEATMDPPYAIYSQSTKPVIIGETGELAANQAGYLNAATPELIATRYPKVTALMYFDASGPNDDYSWSGDGLSSFAGFARAAHL
jgi:hypothetical protein